MVVERQNLPQPVSDRVIDLWAGEVRDAATGQVINHFAHWNRRERVVATELLLAGWFPERGLKFYELAALWPGWLENAIYLQDVRRRFDPPFAFINQAIRPYGWIIAATGIMRWALLPDPKRTVECCPILAAPAIGLLQTAWGAIKHGEFAAAISNALEVLRHAHESHGARILIATCRLCYGQDVGNEVALKSAGYLMKYVHDLARTRDTLGILWAREADRNPDRWGFILDDIREIEARLDEYRVVVENAHSFLEGLTA